MVFSCFHLPVMQPGGEERNNYFTIDYIKFTVSVESGQSSVPYLRVTTNITVGSEWQ